MSKKLGVALGGGGAWSIAGLGVLKALQEAEIEVDYLAGCSMGAMIAAAYASSFAGEGTLQKIEEVVGSMKLRHGLHFNRQHQYGLFSPEKIGHGFEEKVGKFNFEDLKIPLSVVATDFKTGEPVIFDSGPITPAITASAAFALLFAPYPYQGRLLTDGGLSMPTPVEVVKNMGADIIIGVDVTSRQHLKRLDNPITSWHHKITRLIPPLHYATNRHMRKGISQTLDLLFTNLNRANLKNCPPDFLLVPEVTHLNQFSFHQAKKFMEEGEKVTQKILPDLKKLLK